MRDQQIHFHRAEMRQRIRQGEFLTLLARRRSVLVIPPSTDVTRESFQILDGAWNDDATAIAPWPPRRFGFAPPGGAGRSWPSFAG